MFPAASRLSTACLLSQFTVALTFGPTGANAQDGAPAQLPNPPSAGSSADLRVIDNRPDAEKKTRVLSNFIGSCEFGIWSFGDRDMGHTRPFSDRTDRLQNLRLDVEAALGDRARGHLLTVEHYNVYLNNGSKATSGLIFGALLGAGVGGALVGQVAAGSTSSHPKCTRDKMKEGWFDPDELSNGNPPLVVQMAVEWDGQQHLVRAAQSFPRGISSSVMVLSVMDKANAALVAEIQNTVAGPER